MNAFKEDLLRTIACINAPTHGYLDTAATRIHIPMHNITISTSKGQVLFKRGSANLYATGTLTQLQRVKISAELLTYLKMYHTIIKYEARFAACIDKLLPDNGDNSIISTAMNVDSSDTTSATTNNINNDNTQFSA
jgi:hypothetical protein